MTQTTTSEPPGVLAQGLCRRYGCRWVLWDVSLRVPRGTTLLVAGHNGAGKSTLLRILATAIRADHGQAQVAGHDLRQARDEARQSLALLTHQSHLYEALTALENLVLTAGFLHVATERARLTALLGEVGLADRAQDVVATFSAGMRKRLCFARLLLQRAPVILLDEPYGQLDPAGFRWMDATVKSLRAQGATVLIATHQLERAAALCDDGLVLEGGRVVWRGPAHDVARAGGLLGSAEGGP